MQNQNDIFFLTQEESDIIFKMNGIALSVVPTENDVEIYSPEVYEKIADALRGEGIDIDAEYKKLHEKMTGSKYFTIGYTQSNQLRPYVYTERAPTRGRRVPESCDCYPLLLAAIDISPKDVQIDYWRNIRDTLATGKRPILAPDSKYMTIPAWNATRRMHAVLAYLANPPKDDGSRKKDLPVFVGNVPMVHILTTSKLANMLTDNDSYSKTNNMKTLNNDEVTVRCMLYYPKIDSQLKQIFTEYDKAVLNSCLSLCEAGNTSFTPEMVYRNMTGSSEWGLVSEKQMNALLKSVEKCAAIRVTVDVTEELQRRGITNWDDDALKSGRGRVYLLPVESIDLQSVNGKRLVGYSFVKRPFLLEYSEKTGQMKQLPLKVLNIAETRRTKKTVQCFDKSLKNDERRIAIKEYMLRRIVAIKSGIGNRMRLDTIVNEAYPHDEENPPTRREMDAIKKYVLACLDYWEAIGFIDGYKVIRAGKAVHAYEIKYSEEQPKNTH